MAEHFLLNTNFPVLTPETPEVRFDKKQFEEYIKSLIGPEGSQRTLAIREKEDTTEFVDTKQEMIESQDASAPTSQEEASEAPFIKGLLADKATVPSLDERDGKMLTENADVAFSSSGQALVDLFHELEDVISPRRMREVLEKAWQDDAAATLKIIWNARSIHLGKSSRLTFYRAVGWLAENHPLTMVSNLPWLVRPVIQKKIPKEGKEDDVAKDAEMVDSKDADSDFEIVDGKDEDTDGSPRKKKVKLDEDGELAEFDIKYGVAHGYWKDLLNILALAVNDELKVDGEPRTVLNVERPPKKKYLRNWKEGAKKDTIANRHDHAVKKLKEDKFYKALHLTVARLFADQLRLDNARLQSDEKKEKNLITFAAKWAPTHKGMHDQHTCVVSTIAELLHPFDSVCPEDVDPADRELCLKHARIAYQSQTLSPLRKHLEIVERPITAEKFEDIKYDRVPSLAMKQYTPLFAKKDFERFDQYIERVATGKSKISGATLLPSTLVSAVMHPQGSKTKGSAMVEKKLREMQVKVLDEQWNTLVQRIRESGTLTNSIAVTDVSGSMTYPKFPDGTCPMHSSIGLGLLIAESCKPPFGGAFITFHETPEVLRVGGADDKRTLAQKVDYMRKSKWGGNTDFVAVFENLILPMAIENKISQEDMVKQLFVFSDMQFDSAEGDDRWTTSYERIQKKFKDAGYEMPRLIFWNLAGGRAGYGDSSDSEDEGDDETAPKPVTAAQENTALVSGYSQGQLKMFLENGSFNDADDEEVVREEQEGEEGEVILKKEKKKQDPLDVVKKAISHDAYRMLRVVD